MTREQAKQLQKDFGFEIWRSMVTNEGIGLIKEWAPMDVVKAVEKIANEPQNKNDPNFYCEILYLYGRPDAHIRISLPKNWFDLWGWADEEYLKF